MDKSNLSKNSIVADSYVLIPCYFSKLNNINYKKDFSKDKEIIKCIDKLYKSEISKELSIEINRTFLSYLDIIVKDDNEKKENQKILGELYFSYQIEIGIGVLIIAVPEIQCEPTYFYDQVTRDELIINFDNKEVNIKEYFFEKYNINKCGTAITLTHLSRKPNKEYSKYLIANEVYKSDITGKANLCSEDIDIAINNNIAQFDFFEMYVYDTSVMQIDNNFNNVYKERIYTECLTIFIIEIIQFQAAAINRVNYKVYNEMQNKDNFSIKKIQDINLEFSKSIKFWNTNIFIYPATQKISDRLIQAFKTKKLMEVYKENKTFLEHLINTHWIVNTY